jgi:squalene synthase HpnC
VSKGPGDENFPVASRLVAPEHRPIVLAFYRVARLADDVADAPDLAPAEKLARLSAIEDSLEGRENAVPEAATLRGLLAGRGLGPGHVLELLAAFRQDVTKSRYEDWEELMAYCRLSAAPVGRFVLDVHGEDRAVWPASDALCSALQVINHLQDCGDDFRELNRVYLPLSCLRDAGADVDELGVSHASPALRAAIAALARRSGDLLEASRPLPGAVRDRRLSLEIGVIQSLAESLTRRLERRDPLSERVRHSRPEAFGLALRSVAATLASRRRPLPA